MTQPLPARVEVVSTAEVRVLSLTQEFALAWRRTLEMAIELGCALEELKAERIKQLGSGSWLVWVEDRFPLGERMAQNLMRLSEHAQEIADLPPGTTVTAALEWLAERRRAARGPRALPESIDEHPLLLLRFCQANLPTATIVALILRVAFPDAETAVDMTYGSGAFWDGSAHVEVTAHDADSSRALHGVADFTDLSMYQANTFDVALFDPPHLADSSAGSIMGDRYATYPDDKIEVAIRAGTREAWRVARLGVIVKVTDHIHGQEFVSEIDWVRAALNGRKPYDVVHQVRSGALVDPKWEEQLSAYNNGSSYLIFRKGVQKHVRRRRSKRDE